MTELIVPDRPPAIRSGIRVQPEVHGVLNINKPAGMTSHDVVDAVRRILGFRRVGHTGTLDPQATGVLPVCVGRATRIAQFLTQADKEYDMTLRLGITTDTLDAAGKVLSETTDVPVAQSDIEAVLPRFRGTIQQVPPLYSAKKYKGERLYRLARRGETVERPPVAVTIFALTLLECAVPFVRLTVTCSKGTYARSLCDDIGRALGCGGHLHALCRVRSGDFRLAGTVTLDELEARCRSGRLGDALLSLGDALAHLPGVRVAPEAAPLVLHGNAITAAMVAQFPSNLAAGALVRVLGFRKQLLALAETAVASEGCGSGEPTQVVLKPIRVFGGA
ncbi:MAG TPA: tRNA pseudouridine(55) synthase TruB [Candidatus Baltobacteraceae bacterium]|nr:tRNA pseudouridine(55) synthase TruB [Candidatus Baltobacteraceae bacterium]